MFRNLILQYLLFLTIENTRSTTLTIDSDELKANYSSKPVTILDRDLKCQTDNNCTVQEQLDLLDTETGARWDLECNSDFPTDCVQDYGQSQHLCWCVKGTFNDTNKTTELVMKAFINYPGSVVKGNDIYPYRENNKDTAAFPHPDHVYNENNELVAEGFNPYSLEIKCFKGSMSNCAIAYTDVNLDYKLSVFNKENIDDYMATVTNGLSDGGVTVLNLINIKNKANFLHGETDSTKWADENDMEQNCLGPYLAGTFFDLRGRLHVTPMYMGKQEFWGLTIFDCFKKYERKAYFKLLHNEPKNLNDKKPTVTQMANLKLHNLSEKFMCNPVWVSSLHTATAGEGKMVIGGVSKHTTVVGCDVYQPPSDVFSETYGTGNETDDDRVYMVVIDFEEWSLESTTQNYDPSLSNNYQDDIELKKTVIWTNERGRSKTAANHQHLYDNLTGHNTISFTSTHNNSVLYSYISKRQCPDDLCSTGVPFGVVSVLYDLRGTNQSDWHLSKPLYDWGNNITNGSSLFCSETGWLKSCSLSAANTVHLYQCKIGSDYYAFGHTLFMNQESQKLKIKGQSAIKVDNKWSKAAAQKHDAEKYSNWGLQCKDQNTFTVLTRRTDNTTNLHTFASSGSHYQNLGSTDVVMHIGDCNHQKTYINEKNPECEHKITGADLNPPNSHFVELSDNPKKLTYVTQDTTELSLWWDWYTKNGGDIRMSKCYHRQVHTGNNTATKSMIQSEDHREILAYFEFEPVKENEDLHPSYDPSQAASMLLQGRVRTHVCVAEFVKETYKLPDGATEEEYVPLYTQAQRKWDVYKHKYIAEPKDPFYKNPLYYFHGDSCPKPDGAAAYADVEPDLCTWYMDMGKDIHNDVSVTQEQDTHLDVYEGETLKKSFAKKGSDAPVKTDVENAITKETYEVLNCSESIGIKLTHTLKCFLAGTVPPGKDWWSLDASDGNLTSTGMLSAQRNYVNMYGQDAWDEFYTQLQSAKDIDSSPNTVWNIGVDMTLKSIENKTKNVTADQFLDKKSNESLQDDTIDSI